MNQERPLQIAIFLYSGATALDVVGPWEVLSRLPNTEIRFVGKEVGPIATEGNILLLGATHTINSRETDPVEAVRKITGGGADFTLESSGRSAVLRQAIDALAIRGTCGIVGAPALGTEASFDVNGVMTAGKRIIGIIEGDSKPDLFIPALVELYQQGKFPFDKLVKFYTLDQINQAAEDSEKGITIKPIIRL